jgi:phosphomannomutase
MTEKSNPDSLWAHLEYEPVELKFGTSGRRGDVIHLTQLEVYINALAEIAYLQSLPVSEGGIVRGDPFFLAYDLRPSSSLYVETQGGRGEIAQAIVRAIADSGMRPVNLGRVPTPALAHYAITHAKGSIMITGSHIPFDRNGYKVNTSRGELLKKDENPINQRVAGIRQSVYSQPYRESIFNARGLLKTGHQELPPEVPDARNAYINRYTSFFKNSSLQGKKLLCYQHSAVGRDILVEILGQLGAAVVPCGRSDTFVPIDTENIEDSQLASIQKLAEHSTEEHGKLHAVVSTDGDSDRPLMLGIDPESGVIRFFGGDLLGMVTAEFLKADAVVVPISCNDAIDRSRLRGMLEPKTRIGSPYVIEGMENARQRGKIAVCGWEANGGFLTGSDIRMEETVLAALPTRDAILPILCALFAALEKKLSLNELFGQLPKRYGRALLLRQFPRSRALKMVQHFSPADKQIREVRFEGARIVPCDTNGNELPVPDTGLQTLIDIRAQLERVFTPETGFSGIARLNYTDGVRIIFNNEDVAHIRPSGNADELRIYAVAGTQSRADTIAREGVAEPGGILRRMEQAALGDENR